MNSFLISIFSRSIRTSDIQKALKVQGLHPRKTIVATVKSIFNYLLAQPRESLLTLEDPTGCDRGSLLLTAMSRLLNIPARVTYGYSIPSYSAGRIQRVLYWAEFYLPSSGWVPADIRRAAQEPKNGQVFLGTRTLDRLALSPAETIQFPEENGQIRTIQRFDRPLLIYPDGHMEYLEADITFYDARRRDISPGTIIRTIENNTADKKKNK